MLALRMLPVIAVQISPRDAAPVLEERLLSACSTGLRARCVAARNLDAKQSEPSAASSDEPRARAVAFVSFSSPTHVLIEVGRSGGADPAWVSRELDFSEADPELERWRSIGFTIAVLAEEDPAWSVPEAPAPSDAVTLSAAPPVARDAAPAASAASSGVQLDARALAGTGLVGGALRLGAELRVAVPFSSLFCVTGSSSYALAGADALEVRWFDISLGVGLSSSLPWSGFGGRLRLEALAENVSVLARRGSEADRQSAWVPGVSLGSDLLWHPTERWLVSARADLFWLDGATAIRNAGADAGAAAGAGVLAGLGAGYLF